VPASHRWAAAAALVLLAAVTGGCASFDATLGKQEAVVRFQPQTPTAAMLKVRTACSHVPSAKPEKLPAHMTTVAAGYEIRYLVTGASDADLARLQQCLGRFKSVAGIEFTSPDGS
jgi:uncharacterized iron-regulated membrane protein